MNYHYWQFLHLLLPCHLHLFLWLHSYRLHHNMYIVLLNNYKLLCIQHRRQLLLVLEYQMLHHQRLHFHQNCKTLHHFLTGLEYAYLHSILITRKSHHTYRLYYQHDKLNHHCQQQWRSFLLLCPQAIPGRQHSYKLNNSCLPPQMPYHWQLYFHYQQPEQNVYRKLFPE